LAILFLSYPEIKEKISKIVMMGGALGKGNITPAAEFNIYFDPHALE
jgi:inosine-uridine nucleoside N-ribohydrolase